MIVFVSGLPGSGKTTLIKRIMKKCKSYLAIISEEIRVNKERVGFWFVLIDSNKEIMKKELAIKREKPNFGKYFVFVENIEEVLKEAKKRSDRKIIFIDEIGKMERMSKEFDKFVEEILKEKNVVATLHREFIKEFKKYGKVYWLTRENFEKVYKEILHSINGIDS